MESKEVLKFLSLGSIIYQHTSTDTLRLLNDPDSYRNKKKPSLQRFYAVGNKKLKQKKNQLHFYNTGNQ